jgi:hypothetical protein
MKSCYYGPAIFESWPAACKSSGSIYRLVARYFASLGQDGRDPLLLLRLPNVTLEGFQSGPGHLSPVSPDR